MLLFGVGVVFVVLCARLMWFHAAQKMCAVDQTFLLCVCGCTEALMCFIRALLTAPIFWQKNENSDDAAGRAEAGRNRGEPQIRCLTASLAS